MCHRQDIQFVVIKDKDKLFIYSELVKFKDFFLGKKMRINFLNCC